MRLSASSIAGPDTNATTIEFLALHEALEELEQVDTRGAKVVMLRYFSGLSAPEVASIFELSERTVKRDWRSARSWLQERMAEHAREPLAPPAADVEDD